MVRVRFRRIVLLFGLLLVFKPIGFGFALSFCFFTVSPATVKHRTQSAPRNKAARALRRISLTNGFNRRPGVVTLGVPLWGI
ncbi:hypothetical protein SAMN05443246_1094 [Paenibacillus sp. GP183]|nr:hypothetical protein SAMN05443246_1094 [Paenibacillus sp. GP183]